MAGGAGYAQILTSTMVYVSKNNSEKVVGNGFCVQKMAKVAVWSVWLKSVVI